MSIFKPREMFYHLEDILSSEVCFELMKCHLNFENTKRAVMYIEDDYCEELDNIDSPLNLFDELYQIAELVSYTTLNYYIVENLPLHVIDSVCTEIIMYIRDKVFKV